MRLPSTLGFNIGGDVAVLPTVGGVNVYADTDDRVGKAAVLIYAALGEDAGKLLLPI